MIDDCLILQKFKISAFRGCLINSNLSITEKQINFYCYTIKIIFPGLLSFNFGRNNLVNMVQGSKKIINVVDIQHVLFLTLKNLEQSFQNLEPIKNIFKWQSATYQRHSISVNEKCLSMRTLVHLSQQQLNKPI